MSYRLSGLLQAAVYGSLSEDAALSDLVDGVFDALPEGASPDLYVALGAERVTDQTDASGPAAAHVFRVSVVTTREGYAPAKAAAARITEILEAGDLTFSEGRLVSLHFQRAEARRDRRDRTRRIDLTFRARTEL